MEGIVVVGNHGQGNKLSQLSHPFGITVDKIGDFDDMGSNHRVIRWLKGAAQGSVVVGENGKGGQANQLNGPIHLSFDKQNNLYVLDNAGD